jgi:hypothetical protein
MIGLLRLLIDPVKLGRLVGNKVALSEPQRNLLLCILDRVGTMAYVTAHILERVRSVMYLRQLWGAGPTIA